MKLDAFHEYPFETQTFPIRSHLQTKNFDFPIHYHQEVEMIYVESGSIEISVMQKDYKVTEGQLVVIGCNHIHAYNNPVDNEKTIFHILMFDWNLFKGIGITEDVEHLLYPVFFDVTMIDTNRKHELKSIYKLFQKLSLENISSDSGKKLRMIGYLHEIVGLLVSFGNFNENFDSNIKQMEKEHELLSKVNEYIFKYYKTGITLTSAAKELGYSEFHFARQFKRFTGITFKQYLTHYQISMAKEDVLGNELSIMDIALKHGFNSVKTFNRVFKNYFGLPPTIYRKEVNQQHETID